MLELREDDVVHKLNVLVGHHDHAVAKALRLHTFTALFWKDKFRYVCNLTNLYEDGFLKCQYFFEFNYLV